MLNLARNEVILRRPFLDFNLFICWEHNDCEMFHLGQTYHGPQWADCCFFTQSAWESQLLSWASLSVIVSLSLSLHLFCVLNISILPSNLHSCHFFPPTFLTDAVLTHTNLSNYSEIYCMSQKWEYACCITLKHISTHQLLLIVSAAIPSKCNTRACDSDGILDIQYVWLLVWTCSDQCTFISN